jgi:hypothetical protein
MIRQVTYISTAKTPVSPRLLSEIEAIAQRKNTANGLSGLLLFDGVRFLQVLEGPSALVDVTLTAIRADDRHFGFVMLRDQMVEIPSFPIWSMLCRRLNSDQDLRALVRRSMNGADKMTRALFESFTQVRAI